MALTPFSSAILQRFSGSGTDSASLDNTKRTPPIFIGGHEFTLILRDTHGSGVQTGFKVQVNNSNLYKIPLDVKKHKVSLESVEPLKSELEDFLSAIDNQSPPLVTGKEGLEAIKIVESGLKSILSKSKVKI